MRKSWFVFGLLGLTTAAFASFLPPSFSTGYEESFTSATTGKVKRSYGKIDYKFPRHIRFEVTGPDQSTFVANPKTSWYYTPPFIANEEGQVIVQRSEDLVLTKFLDSLKNGAQSNAAYKVAFDKNKLIITFNDALKNDLKIEKAILMAPGEASKVDSLGGFQELELFHTNKRQVKMKFLEFKAGTSFAPDHFNFKVPPKTKVVKGK